MGFIYKLRFSTGRAYVGLTRKTVGARFCEHASCVGDPRKKSVLYNAWRKHGAPILEVLAEVPDHLLLAAEVAAIAEHGTLYPNGYNTTAGGDVCPMHTPAVAQKVSDAKMGKKRPDLHTESSREKLRAARLGAKMSPESKARLSAARKGVPSPLRGRALSPERCAAMSAAQKGRAVPEERRRKISAALVGKVQSAETIAKRVAAVKATWAAKRQGAQCQSLSASTSAILTT